LRHDTQFDTRAVRPVPLVILYSAQPLRFHTANTRVPLGPRASLGLRPRITAGIKNGCRAA
jgi:hypothetical protein